MPNSEEHPPQKYSKKKYTNDDTTVTTTQKTEYDPMDEEPPPAIITPSYVPLRKKKNHWGDPCKPAVICEGPKFIQIYSQNDNGISESTGMKYDDTFEHMKEADTANFSVNETHAEKINAKNNDVLEKSR